MTKILTNYSYQYYPFTTASYIDKAILDRPDLCLVHRGDKRPPCADLVLNIEPLDNIIRLPGKKCAYWEIDNHIHRGEDTRRYDQVDYIFVTQKHFLDLYPSEKTYWLPLAADPKEHKFYSDEPVEYDIGFLGNDTYPRRRQLLELMNQKYKVLWSNAQPGEEYSRKLSRCRLLFNCSMDNDLNMRFFETISIGRLLLTDKVDGQDDLFVDGADYVSYQDWPDLDNKIQYYLDHPQLANIIAETGRKHLLSQHTYSDRLQEILKITNLD